MPFQSRSQMRTCFGGGMGNTNCRKWARETKNICNLPAYKGESKSRKRSTSRVSISKVQKGSRGGKYVVVSGIDKGGRKVCSYKMYVGGRGGRSRSRSRSKSRKSKRKTRSRSKSRKSRRRSRKSRKTRSRSRKTRSRSRSRNSRKGGGTKYTTLDNGGDAYLVVKHGNTVDIYNSQNDKKVKTYNNVKKVFVGKPRGNSILLRISEKRYVFIGHNVYEFETKEPITKYYSEIGNSAVPYPVAVSRNYAYYMLDKAAVPKDEFDDLSKRTPLWRSSYRLFYKLPKSVQNKKMLRTKVVHRGVF